MASSVAIERVHLIALWLSVILFVAACALPSLQTRYVPARTTNVAGNGSVAPIRDETARTVRGFELILYGFTGLFVLHVTVLGNAAIVIAWFALRARQWRWALALAVLALVFAANLLSINSTGGVYSSGVGGSGRIFIERPLIGCVLWLASMLVVGIGAVVCGRLAHRTGERDEDGAMAGEARNLSAATLIDRVRLAVAWLGVYLFVAACALPALRLRTQSLTSNSQPVSDAYTGAHLLAIGALAVALLNVAWLANLALIAAWIALLVRRWRTAFALALVATMFAADLLTVNPRGGLDAGYVSPGNGPTFIDLPLIGCYFWLASMLAIGGGAAVCWRLGWGADRLRGEMEASAAQIS